MKVRDVIKRDNSVDQKKAINFLSRLQKEYIFNACDLEGFEKLLNYYSGVQKQRKSKNILKVIECLIENPIIPERVQKEGPITRKNYERTQRLRYQTMYKLAEENINCEKWQHWVQQAQQEIKAERQRAKRFVFVAVTIGALAGLDYCFNQGKITTSLLGSAKKCASTVWSAACNWISWKR